MGRVIFNNGLPLGNSGAANALATAPNVAAQGLSNFGVGRSNDRLGFGGLVLSASSESVSFLLRALSQNHRLEVLLDQRTTDYLKTLARSHESSLHALMLTLLAMEARRPQRALDGRHD